MYGEQAGGRRDPDDPQARGDGAGHAGAVRVRRFLRADRAEALCDHALQVGMCRVDLRVHHRDRNVGASDQAVNVGELELLQDVLRGIALLGGIAARCGLGLLVRQEEVVRLHQRVDLGGREQLDDLPHRLAVGDAETQQDGVGARETLRGKERQSEAAQRVLELRHADARGDLHHHLVGDECVSVSGGCRTARREARRLLEAGRHHRRDLRRP